MSNKTIEENAGRYIVTWNETTFENVKASLEQCCIPEVSYTDKNKPVIYGLDELANYVIATGKEAPERILSLNTPPECFDHNCYYSWLFKIPGKIELIGRDYMEYNDENLITRIVAFAPVQ